MPEKNSKKAVVEVSRYVIKAHLFLPVNRDAVSLLCKQLVETVNNLIGQYAATDEQCPITAELHTEPAHGRVELVLSETMGIRFGGRVVGFVVSQLADWAFHAEIGAAEDVAMRLAMLRNEVLPALKARYNL